MTDAGRSLEVDGETFVVTVGAHGAHDLRWSSGPDPQYGFTIAASDGSAVSRVVLEEAARGFLAAIDPATGYLADDEV